ncbi:hypothetical protein Tco_0031506 [Tanacetum coccineum]
MEIKKESFNPLEIEDDLFSYESPACLQFEQNTRIHTNSDIETIDSPSNMQETSERLVRIAELPTFIPDFSFFSGYEAVLWKSFDVEADYAKMFANPYSRRFDKYRQIFINEVEQLSNEYELKIGKKGYVLDDVWEKCEQNHGGTTYAWHDKGHEEEELWKCGIEKAEYAPPIVNIETFKVKRYSFTGGRIFICITKQFDDTLPLGRANWSQFARMIRKELVTDKSTQGAT